MREQPGVTDGIDATKTHQILSKPANRSTPARLRAFLEAYCRTGRMNRACEIAHITPKTHYRRFASDPVYRRAFEEAGQQVGQMLEDTAVKRALAGDNNLLLALLKRFRPELYRERAQTQVTGQVNIVDRLQAARKRMAEIERRAQVG